MYETGVAYFEREGALQANAVTLPVPAGHLDDALKTLVVLSKDGAAQVSGIEFASSVSRDMARALAGLGKDPGGDAGADTGADTLSYRALLASLKGSSIEVKAAGETARGRLIDVLEPAADAEQACEMTQARDGTQRCVKRQDKTLLLLTERAEIRRFRTRDVTSVRALDGAFKARLGSALDALGRHGTQNTREVRLLGGAATSVTLGYVAEAPVWRSTYRLVLSDDEAILQGWALVHNDTDEDWGGVRVELVNGQPDSFLFPLAAPRYARRELVTPERELSTVPQLLGRTVDNMWSGAGGIGLAGIGQGGGGYGVGAGRAYGAPRVRMGGVKVGVDASPLLNVGNLAHVDVAEGTESPALFQYALAGAVDLRAHGSALLPFAQISVQVRRIAFLGAPGDQARSAVHLEHRGRQTLPAGPIAVFESGGFAGESGLTRTKPGEHRIIRFGFDMDVELDSDNQVTRDTSQVLSFAAGRLTEHFLRSHEIRYRLRNRSGSARTVYLALPYVNNSRVTGADGLEYDREQEKALAVFETPAGFDAHRNVVVEEGLSKHYEASELGAQTMRRLAASTALPTGQRAVLRSAALHYDDAALHGTERKALEKELEVLTEDVERLRRHVAALRGAGARSAERLVARLLSAEDRTRQIRGRKEKLAEMIEKANRRAVNDLRKLTAAAEE